MADWLVSPCIEKLVEKFIDIGSKYLQDQRRWQTGMKKELVRLRENHPKIQAVVSAASQAQKIDPDSAINKWIWQLRDAIDEADDVLDDFEYMKHEEHLAREKTKVSSTMRKLKKFGKRAFKSDPMLKRLEEVVHKLDKISAELSTFLHLLKDTKQEQQVQQDKLQNDRETGSMPTDVLIGRGQDKESVIQWLGKLPNEEHQSHVSNIPNYNNISVLSIVGPGGLGKTTLLQHIYEDKSTNVFDPKMWVCVSNNFDSKTVLIDMLGSPQNTTLDALQKSLKSKVTSKKFLLVLDDIWEEDEVRDKIKWEKVLAPLAYGGLGSKILITTRMKSAASMIEKVIKKENESLIIKGLDDDECLHLLNTHAFAGVKNLNDHKKLESITKEFVKKLYGSPLAAKVLGGALNSKLDERRWINVLNNVLSLNGISSILKLSYIFLPEYLQNCFAFCSIFKQDHLFNRDDLVRMWIAVGFIQPSCIREETLEDIGERYFDILVKKSFFDKFDERYKMHDLLHELAQSVSAQECFRIVGDEVSDLGIPENIRHLSINTDNFVLLKNMRKFKNLQTLCITTYCRDNQDLVDVLAKFFEESRSIRLLSICGYHWKMIPETVECLKHLRYLRLDTLLPRSVSNLYYLQFLICNYQASHDDLFPRDMNNLSSLRYLSLPHLKFPGIGKLKFLQELNGFKVKNETGYRFEELEHMNDLRILRIQGLENVTDAHEACNAKLCDKRKLTDLSLEWEASRQNIVDLDIYERVLDNLQPHSNLQKLTMNGYMGVRSTIWMDNANLINNLKNIILSGCFKWKILPPFGQLRFLKSLSLSNMPKAERFGNIFHGNDTCCVFPALEELCINNLEALVNWFEAGVDCLFPCLTELQLNNCPNLQELPYLPPKLKNLTAQNIGWKTLNCCCNILGPSGTFFVNQCPNISSFFVIWKIIGGPGVLNNVILDHCFNLLSIGGHQEVETTENCLNLIVDELKIRDASVLQMEPMRSITSIRKLKIENNDGAASFPFEAEWWFLQVSSSLRELHIENLKSLQSLPSYLKSLSSLEILRLENIPLLKSLPDLPPSLSVLDLYSLPKLNCLPSCLPTLSSLTNIEIKIFPQLQELPDLPPSLCSLKLYYLENLNCLSSCLPSLSSLTKLDIWSAPELRELPDLPPSLCELELCHLDNLNCLPSCLPTLSSLRSLSILNVPQLRELPDLPTSVYKLNLNKLDNLDCLPSCLPSLSSLTELHIDDVPRLRELPDLPPSLCRLYLIDLDNLNCLPSCLPTLSSLDQLTIKNVPQLQELPNLPPSLKNMKIEECDPEFMKRYGRLWTGFR